MLAFSSSGYGGVYESNNGDLARNAGQESSDEGYDRIRECRRWCWSQTRGRKVGSGVVGKRDWAASVILVAVASILDADAAESANGTLLWSSNVEKRIESSLYGKIVSQDGGLLWKIQEDDKVGDPKNATGAEKAGRGDEDVGIS